MIANENSAFIAEKCLSDNNKYPEKEISAIIYEVGAVRVFIPLNLGDVVGHSDGYLSFLQEDTICVIEYAKTEIFKTAAEYANRLSSVCKDFNFGTIPIYERPLKLCDQM